MKHLLEIFFFLARGLYSEVKGPEHLPIMQAATITMIMYQQATRIGT